MSQPHPLRAYVRHARECWFHYCTPEEAVEVVREYPGGRAHTCTCGLDLALSRSGQAPAIARVAEVARDFRDRATRKRANAAHVPGSPLAVAAYWLTWCANQIDASLSRSEQDEETRADSGLLWALNDGLLAIRLYSGEGQHLESCNGGENAPCDCGYVDPLDAANAMFARLHDALFPSPVGGRESVAGEQVTIPAPENKERTEPRLDGECSPERPRTAASHED